MSTTLAATVCRLCGRVRPFPWRTHPTVGRILTHDQPTSRQLWVGSVFRATAGESRITTLLTEKLTPTYIEVRDISGGCGSMYEIVIDSQLFEGKRLVQQHRLVNEALGDEVKSLHGMTIRIGNPRKEP